MKNMILAVMLPATVLMCKQDEKVTNDSYTNESSTKTSVAPTTASPAADAAEISSPEKVSPLKVGTIDASPDLGMAVFTENGNAVMSFNTMTQKGKIKINGKEYTLDKLTFSENRYELRGNGITITANEGNFDEIQSDCLYGVFPEVKVKLNNEETVLKNIKVQDCPNLN